MGGGSGSKKQLGKIMLQQKLVSQSELQELLIDQARDGGRLASTAMRQGRVSAEDALAALSEQHGVPAVDLTARVITLTVLKLIPREMAIERVVCPFATEGDRVLLAMSSPGEEEVAQELEFVAGKTVVRHVALDHVLRQVVEQAYDLLAAGHEYYIGANVSDDELTRRELTHLPRAEFPELPPGEPQRATGTRQPNAGRSDGTGSEVTVPRRKRRRGKQAAASAELAQPTEAAQPAAEAPEPTEPESQDDKVTAQPGPEPGHDAQPEPPPAEDELFSEPPPEQRTRSEAPPLDEAFSERTPPSQPPTLPTHDETARLLVGVADPELRESLRVALQEVGVTVLEADNGTRALELVRDGAPKVVLVEPMLDQVHGFDVCRRLKSSRHYHHIPVMVIAEQAGWRLAQDLKETFGVEHVIAKSTRSVDLIRTVRLVLADQPVRAEPPPLSAKAETCWCNAMDAFERGELSAAIEELQGGAASEPDVFELQYHLGLLYGRRDDTFAAIAALERATSMQPTHFSALKNLAVLYQRAGFRHQAVDTWERALEVAPNDETRVNIKEHMISLL